MADYPELTLALEAMQAQAELYRPTTFWEQASVHITAQLRQNGMERFRALSEPLSFFVPTYGVPGNAFSEEQVAGLRSWFAQQSPDALKPRIALDQFLSGYSWALSDYRVLLAADDPGKRPFLHRFSESTVGHPKEHFDFDGRRFSRSSLNYLLGLSLLKKHLGPELPRTVLEIGGGFGSLGEVLSSTGVEGLHYIDIDIPPTSVVAQYYLSEVLGQARVATFTQTRDWATIDIPSLPQAAVLCSWQIERLRGQVDLFVNFVSFQEMEPHIVGNYLDHVCRLGARWILLRNLREGKQLRGDGVIGVDTPTLGDDYLTMLPDYDLVQRQSLPFGYRTTDGFHSEILLLRRRV